MEAGFDSKEPARAGSGEALNASSWSVAGVVAPENGVCGGAAAWSAHTRRLQCRDPAPAAAPRTRTRIMKAYALASRAAPAGLQLGASVAVDFHPDSDFDDLGLTPDLPHRDLPISSFFGLRNFRSRDERIIYAKRDAMQEIIMIIMKGIIMAHRPGGSRGPSRRKTSASPRWCEAGSRARGVARSKN